MAGSPEIALVLDAETTGFNVTTDQIIELSVQKGLDPEAKQKTWRFKPDVPIGLGAEAAHGISARDLRGCPRFSDEARKAIIE